MQRDVIAPAPHPQVVTAVHIERIRAHRSGLSVFRLWINYCVRLARSPLTQTLFHHSPLSPRCTPGLEVGLSLWNQIIVLVTLNHCICFQKLYINWEPHAFNSVTIQSVWNIISQSADLASQGSSIFFRASIMNSLFHSGYMFVFASHLSMNPNTF